MTRGKLWFWIGIVSLMTATLLLGMSMRRGHLLWLTPGIYNFTEKGGVSLSVGPIATALKPLVPQVSHNQNSSAQHSTATGVQSTQQNPIPKLQAPEEETHILSLDVVPAKPQSLPPQTKPEIVAPHVPVTHHELAETYTYPEWWEKAWPRSAVSWQKVFVDDQPLFPPCKDGVDIVKGYPFEEPRHYLPNSKNPCWYEYPEERKGLRCAPYFYLAGVAKGGTSDLYRRIRLHPDVMTGSEKEYHWWDRGRYEHLSKDPISGNVSVHGGVSLGEYSDRVTTRGLEDLADDLNERGHSIKIFGDGSPSYMWDSFYWVVLDGNQGCVEPRVITGHHIRHFYPEAKIILTFRHPTSRLYSRFLSRIPRTSYLRKATSEDFHRYVVQAVRLYRSCYDKWSIRHCAYNHTLYTEATVRVVEGMYPVFMADWLRIWPKEQMIILRYEDYSENMESVMKNVFSFLELAPLKKTDMDFVTQRDAVNVGDMYDKVGQMLPQTKEILDDFYRPFVHKFAEILNDKRFLWLDKE